MRVAQAGARNERPLMRLFTLSTLAVSFADSGAKINTKQKFEQKSLKKYFQTKCRNQ